MDPKLGLYCYKPVLNPKYNEIIRGCTCIEVWKNGLTIPIMKCFSIIRYFEYGLYFVVTCDTSFQILLIGSIPISWKLKFQIQLLTPVSSISSLSMAYNLGMKIENRREPNQEASWNLNLKIKIVTLWIMLPH